MGWFIGFLGLNQEGGKTPVFDGLDVKGTQGPAIDIKFNLSNSKQRKFYNFLRGVGFDLWLKGVVEYAVFDGRTLNGDHGPVIFYESEKVPTEERPPPTPPAPPPGAGMPGYALNNSGRLMDTYTRQPFSDRVPFRKFEPGFTYT